MNQRLLTRVTLLLACVSYAAADDTAPKDKNGVSHAPACGAFA